MSKFRGHKFTWSKPFGTVRYSWSFYGPNGGVEFNASVYEGNPSCGLEFHHTRSAGYRCDEAPDHLKCHITNEPCWHEGTSLYASDTLWPQICSYLQYGSNHDAIFLLLEDEYNKRFDSLMLVQRVKENGGAE
jgi:hypothetical protein